MVVVLFQGATSEWLAIFKQVGVLGVVCVFFGIIIWKVFIPMIQGTIEDARKERDTQRQLLKDQAAQFVAHIKEENEEFRESLKNVVDAFERSGRKK